MEKKSFPYTADATKYVEGFGYGSTGQQFNIGDIIYPILVEPENGAERYTYSHRPGQTNMSHEERIDGWLGCTDGVHQTALGKYEIIGFTSRTIQCKRLDQ
jgi:hypothetical protein